MGAGQLANTAPARDLTRCRCKEFLRLVLVKKIPQHLKVMHAFKRLYSAVNVDPLLTAVQANDHLWREITARQSAPGSPHVDTETIFLRWAQTRTVDAAFTEIPAIDYPANSILPEAYDLVAELLRFVNAGELGRVIIAKLLPWGQIDWHADEGAYSDHYERFHISLQSKEGNLFLSGSGEWAHMRAGEAWWFNHKLPHHVINATDTPRLHLIVDCVAPEYRRERESERAEGRVHAISA